MSTFRPLFASVLLAVVLVGGALGPAAHWASHGLEEHEAPVEVADGYSHAATTTEAEHTAECLGCAHIQKVLGSEPAVLPSYLGVVGLEQAVQSPEDPAIQRDIATPEERGPPTAV